MWFQGVQKTCAVPGKDALRSMQKRKPCSAVLTVKSMTNVWNMDWTCPCPAWTSLAEQPVQPACPGLKTKGMRLAADCCPQLLNQTTAPAPHISAMIATTCPGLPTVTIVASTEGATARSLIRNLKQTLNCARLLKPPRLSHVFSARHTL